MANRYVWSRYNINLTLNNQTAVTASTSIYTGGFPMTIAMTANSSSLVPGGMGSTGFPVSAYLNTESATSTATLSGVNSRYTVPANTYFAIAGAGGTAGKAHFNPEGATICIAESTSRVGFQFPRPYTVSYDAEKGTANGTVSNSSSSAHPTDSYSGSYWYVYQGSDSIDASAVSYSTQTPMGGKSITINVTPRSNTYGGTIQYTYQVQLSGGSWTTIATKTTATSQQYTIPAGTTSFAARVVANDTWGFSSSTYTTGSTLTVTNNQPPTAPGSISIGTVIGGQQCTITWTAATDPDGTIASYQLQRQVDNGNTWTQIYSGPNLTYTDTINADWATVNYRVKATDDDGASGPYATGTMQTVNSGWLYFSGPPSDMGEQPAPFDFVFSIGSTGASSASNIAVTVIYDDEVIYTGTVASAQQITLNIDTRLTYAGDHDIIVTATADGFLPVTQQCDFTVPSVTLPNGGSAGFMEDDAGNTYYPATLARYVIGLKGLDANALFDRVYTGTYTGTGTSGSGNPCSVRTSFEPILVFIQAAAASTATSGYWVNSAPGQSSQGNMIVNNNGTVTLCPVTWDAEAMTLSWYGTSAAAQLNASGTVYGIIALGGMA